LLIVNSSFQDYTSMHNERSSEKESPKWAFICEKESICYRNLNSMDIFFDGYGENIVKSTGS